MVQVFINTPFSPDQATLHRNENSGILPERNWAPGGRFDPDYAVFRCTTVNDLGNITAKILATQWFSGIHRLNNNLTRRMRMATGENYHKPYYTYCNLFQ
jgi:hypothetical protein